MSTQYIFDDYPGLDGVLKQWRKDLIHCYINHGNEDYVNILFALGIVAGADLDRGQARQLLKEVTEGCGLSRLMKKMREISKIPARRCLRYEGELDDRLITLRVQAPNGFAAQVHIAIDGKKYCVADVIQMHQGPKVTQGQTERFGLLMKKMVELANLIKAMRPMRSGTAHYTVKNYGEKHAKKLLKK